MKQHTLLAILIFSTTIAVASNTRRDSDGVPKVDVHGKVIIIFPESLKNGFHLPEVRVRIISVDNKEMPLNEFLLKFCSGKLVNETCNKAGKIQSIDSISGPTEQLPQGL